MLIVDKLLPRARGLAPALVRRAASVELDWDVRQKSRFDAVDSTGRPVGVFLPRGTVVRGDDVLVAQDGTLLHVRAAPQPVLVVTACAEHGSPFDLMRAAYHLGNRHVALELRPDRLKLEPDHVLASMLRRMHLIVTAADEAFEPEAGAYAHGGGVDSNGHDPVHQHQHREHAHPGAREDAHAHSQACEHEHEGHGAALRDAHGSGA